MRDNNLADERDCLQRLVQQADLAPEQRASIAAVGAELIDNVRASKQKNLMEAFMAHYGLTTDEGVALMCLAEAMLRVPDAITASALIEDKISPFEWKSHMGKAESLLVNASTVGLVVTAEVLTTPKRTLLKTVHGLVKKLGEPVIRKAVAVGMKELGRQFVLGQTIKGAIRSGKSWQKKGYTYSYDMLGEAAKTEEDAVKYYDAYTQAISTLAEQCNYSTVEENPGISIKLSALFSRYEPLQKDRVMDVLVNRVRVLAVMAKDAGMGLNIDAEEAERLDISLDVIEAILADDALKGWDGFGVVIQTYSKRGSDVIDWVYALAETLDRKFTVRLVKGAYWDAEIKRAQVLGLDDFPVFTRKAETDMAYIACTKQLFAMQDRIYPQFATHNAHTMAAVLELAPANAHYEFQRLHGMGESLHAAVLARANTRCRIYAPVGSHEDLLAYLVRRLLENGANSSFVHKIADPTVASQDLASDPFAEVDRLMEHPHHRGLSMPEDVFGKARKNAKGWDINDITVLDELLSARSAWSTHQWHARSSIGIAIADAKEQTGHGAKHWQIVNPSNLDDVVGSVVPATKADVKQIIDTAHQAPVMEVSGRLKALNKAADLFEEHHVELFALLCREAGKTLADAVGELREAVDFLRYYALEAKAQAKQSGNGTFVCISPWNFPLAIFTGQIAAALAMGNKVIAKPAEQASLIAARAVSLLHEAGIQPDSLQLLTGNGREMGDALLADDRIGGVCFTGSTITAQAIHKNMALNLASSAPLIAETGGLNAMIVDSTALPEQAVRDIVASGFQSAGQRCSALRMLYIQDDIADKVIDMLKGAMEQLVLGDSWSVQTDVGPVIDEQAKEKIQTYIDQRAKNGQLMTQINAPAGGHFIGPALVEVAGIHELGEEIFGPVIHIARFKASEYDQVVDDINDTGYGLTFCLHSRIESRVASTCDQIKVGNSYVNRNQIGAIVGSQPFGGEGLSGTGPKAGGPNYLSVFAAPKNAVPETEKSETVKNSTSEPVPLENIQEALDKLGQTPELKIGESVSLPGPTGESNTLSFWSKGVFLCIAPNESLLKPQLELIKNAGAKAVAIYHNATELQWLADMDVTGDVIVLNGSFAAENLASLKGYAGVLTAMPESENKLMRKALSKRAGAILPLMSAPYSPARLVHERHVSIDTTASGGNAALLTAVE